MSVLLNVNNFEQDNVGRLLTSFPIKIREVARRLKALLVLYIESSERRDKLASLLTNNIISFYLIKARRVVA